MDRLQAASKRDLSVIDYFYPSEDFDDTMD